MASNFRHAQYRNDGTQIDDPQKLGDFTQEQTQASVSGAWTLSSSGSWRQTALGALPRFAVNGGSSGGTWAISYRNAAGTITSDPAETVAAGVSDVSPIFLDDATEIMVSITGTVTVEIM